MAVYTPFVSEARTKAEEGEGEPLLRGLVVDLGGVDEDDVDAREKAVVEAVRRMEKAHTADGGFKAPYLVMDVGLPRDVKLLEVPEEACAASGGVPARDYKASGSERVHADFASKLAYPDCAYKVLVPCLDIVDLRTLKPSSEGPLGMSLVKCNAAVPVYRWFQAANLLLAHLRMKGRVMPFPLAQKSDDDDGAGEGIVGEDVVYHMLRVTPPEFKQYQELLDYSVAQNGLEKGFHISAKFAYEVLEKRGVPFASLTHDVVDHTMTHVHIMRESRLRAVVLHNASKEDFEGEMRTSHYIYY